MANDSRILRPQSNHKCPYRGLIGSSRGGFNYREKIDHVTPETGKDSSHGKLEEP